MPFVLPQEVLASRQLVVDNVEDFSVNAGGEARQHDRISAVVHIGEGDAVSTPQVDKTPERADTNSRCQLWFARPEDVPRPHGYIWNLMVTAIVHYQLFLFELGIGVGLVSDPRVRFGGTVLVKYGMPFQLVI
jgi:hypothetical protein